jgi:hypothetical protein
LYARLGFDQAVFGIEGNDIEKHDIAGELLAAYCVPARLQRKPACLRMGGVSGCLTSVRQ